MYVYVNNGERPYFGETAKTTARRVMQRYFDYVEFCIVDLKIDENCCKQTLSSLP